MPLMLNTPETARPVRVTWDPSSWKQFDEAVDQISTMRANGYRYLRPAKIDDGEALLVPPDREPHQCLMRILDESGDRRVVWDRRQRSQVEDARKMFNDLIASGHTAYAARMDGTKGSRIDEFDSVLGEVVMVPKTHPG